MVLFYVSLAEFRPLQRNLNLFSDTSRILGDDTQYTNGASHPVVVVVVSDKFPEKGVHYRF